MEQYENTIRLFAIIGGWIALLTSTISAMVASRRLKGRSTGGGARFRSRQGIFFITIGFIIAGFLLWKPIPLIVSRRILFGLTIFGTFPYFGGIGLYLWGLATMRSQFAVSSVFGAKLHKEHQLITNGPFAIVRHPLYVGVILTAFGALLVFKTWAMMIFAPLSFIVIGRAKQEEKLLEHEFGEEWKDYASKVPKWIPKLTE